jgi:hypothetical protein
VSEPTCRWCDAGCELIGDYHYARVGGMVFPLNKRCEKIHPPKPKPAIHPVFLLPNLQCSTCGSAMDFVPCQLSSDAPNAKTTHWPARCEKCELTVLVPLTLRTCEVVG